MHITAANCIADVSSLLTKMSTKTATDTETGTVFTIEPWQGGVVGGIVGGLAFGAMMSMMMTDVMQNAIPGMYGLGPEAGAIGWIFHMSHAAILGVVFAAIAAYSGIETMEGVGRTAAAGLVYGAVLWLALAVIVMPLWVGAMTPAEPPVPNVNVQSLIGHAVYGLLLGGVYAALVE